MSDWLKTAQEITIKTGNWPWNLRVQAENIYISSSHIDIYHILMNISSNNCLQQFTTTPAQL